MLIGGIVDRVVGNGGSECAGNDALQRTGTGNAAELNVLKQEARSIIKGRDAGARESVREPQTSERKLLYRIRGKHGESCAVLIVVLDELRIDTHRLALQERQLASLVETVAAGEDRKTGRDGAIEKIGLGEAEHEAALNVAELSGEGESFAEAEKIVGLIGETDERAGQAADPALQTDRLLALFLELQSEIDSAFFLIALDLNRFVFLDAVEVIELVQTQDADFPGALVEKLALIEKKFAADDFVAGGGVADKIDAADVILLFFVKAQSDVNALRGVVDIKLGLGGEIDEAVLAIGFGVILHGFADFGGGEDVAVFEGEDGPEGVDLKREGFIGIGADDFQRSHVVALALFDGNGDIHRFAVATAGNRNAHAETGGVNIFEDRIFHNHFEVAIVLIQTADAHFKIFVELFAVVGFGENGNVPEIKRNCVRTIVAHGANELAIAEGVIPGKFDLADLYLRPFFHFENQDDGIAGGNALVLRRNFGELASMLAEQFLQDNFGLLDAGGIELAFHGEADLALFEAIENVGFRNGMDIVVANAAYDRALFDFEDHRFVIRAIGRIFDAQLHVFKELRVPQGLKITAQRLFIVRIAIATENSRF